MGLAHQRGIYEGGIVLTPLEDTHWWGDQPGQRESFRTQEERTATCLQKGEETTQKASTAFLYFPD